jgi:hypothetical protein
LHIAAEAQTRGNNITHFYEGPVPEHFRNLTKAHSLMVTLVDVGVAARPAMQKAPNYRT